MFCLVCDIDFLKLSMPYLNGKIGKKKTSVHSIYFDSAFINSSEFLCMILNNVMFAIVRVVSA